MSTRRTAKLVIAALFFLSLSGVSSATGSNDNIPPGTPIDCTTGEPLTKAQLLLADEQARIAQESSRVNRVERLMLAQKDPPKECERRSPKDGCTGTCKEGSCQEQTLKFTVCRCVK